MPSSVNPQPRPEAAEPQSGPDWLAVSMEPLPGARSNTLDRHTLAVIGYLQGSSGRYVTAESTLRRWPSWKPAPTDRALRSVLARLVKRGLVTARDGGYRVNRQKQREAAELGCRFRYAPADFAANMSAATIEFVAMVRGRSHGRSTAWGDSAQFLADRLGANERTVRMAIAEATAAGRLEVVAHSRLRTGHHLPVLRVVENDERQPRQPHLRAERSPGCSERSPGCAERSPDNLVPQGTYLASLGSSRAPVALLTWTPEAKPTSPGQSRATGADDPIRRQPPQPQKPVMAAKSLPTATRVLPPWLELDGLERAAVAAMGSWSAFRSHMRVAVGRLHLAESAVDQVHRCLIAVGAFLPWQSNMTTAGRAGLRRKRVELAEQLVAQQVEPSLVLEFAYLRACALEAQGAEPRAVAADLIASLSPKSAAFIARSNASVAAGKGPLPMAAGADALGRLVQPQNRLAGDFAYPAAWWKSQVDQEVLERVADVRTLVASVAATAEVREVGGEVAAAKLREAFAKAERERRERALARQRDGATKSAASRIVGACMARDWRRLAAYLGENGTAATAAELSGVPEAEIAAGLATVTRRATA